MSIKPSSHASLIVMTGPQAGQRLKIKAARVEVGRDAACPIVLRESHVSRQQFELERTADGWMFENLSSNGTLINGKRYKGGMKLVLGSGDVIGAGLKTEMIFIEENDDPSEIVTGYIKVHPAAAGAFASQSPSAGQVVAEQASAKTDLGSAVDPASIQGDAKGAPAPTVAVVARVVAPATAAVTPASPYRKYLIAGAVSMGLCVLFVAVMSLRDQTTITPEQITRLSDEQIKSALLERPNVQKSQSLAADALRSARAEADRPGRLYACVRHYKAYMAYRGSSSFEDPTDEEAYNQALYGRPDGQSKGLIELVTNEYNKGCDYEQTQRWSQALASFQIIITTLVPEDDPTNPTYQQLMSNVYEHCNHVLANKPDKK